jgi:hypothetical protein
VTGRLRDLIALCHPDRHPPERAELATRVTAFLIALRARPEPLLDDDEEGGEEEDIYEQEDWPRCEASGSRFPSVDFLEHHQLRDCRAVA